MIRGLPVAAVTSVVLVLSACAATAPPTSSPAATPSELAAGADVATVGAPPRYAPAVVEPKDARGIAACDLVTDDQLIELGLLPASFEETTTANTRSCTWSSAADDTNPVGLELNDETTIPVLDDLYLTRTAFATYEPRNVAGHPALRADLNDNGSCAIITAIADYQAVEIGGNAAARPLPDPCALPTRMAEFIIANLPPLTEE